MLSPVRFHIQAIKSHSQRCVLTDHQISDLLVRRFALPVERPGARAKRGPAIVRGEDFTPQIAVFRHCGHTCEGKGNQKNAGKDEPCDTHGLFSFRSIRMMRLNISIQQSICA
jgi:hypothetical protein